MDGCFVRFDAARCVFDKLPIFIGKPPLKRVATPLGFEPRITPPKGAVLPLHHGVNGVAILDWRFSIQAQCPKFKCDCPLAEQLNGKIEVESWVGGASVILSLRQSNGYGAHYFPSALSRLSWL
jgi:hypothetical protein